MRGAKYPYSSGMVRVKDMVDEWSVGQCLILGRMIKALWNCGKRE